MDHAHEPRRAKKPHAASDANAPSAASAEGAEEREPDETSSTVETSRFVAKDAEVGGELSDKLHVVDSAADRRLPNDVTEAEMDDAANAYTKVQLDEGDLTIDKKMDDTFRKNMSHDLTDLLETETGRSQIEKLSDNETKNPDGSIAHHHTTLTSYLDNGKPNYTESGVSADDHDAFDAGKPSDATVHINPNHLIRPPRSRVVGDRGSERSDEALTHELAHTLDVTHGTLRRLPVPVDERPDGDRNAKLPADAPLRQEYDAIGLLNPPDPLDTENHYRAERKMLGEAGANLEPDDADQELRTSATYVSPPKKPSP